MHSFGVCLHACVDCVSVADGLGFERYIGSAVDMYKWIPECTTTPIGMMSELI